MTIRQLQINEVRLCVDGGKEFFMNAGSPIGFDADYFVRVWIELISDKRAVILGMFNDEGKIIGALGALIAPSLFSPKIVATEGFWYVCQGWRGKGIELLLAFEQWSRTMEADYVAMIHLHELQPDKLARLYERMGYQRIETNYLKKLI